MIESVEPQIKPQLTLPQPSVYLFELLWGWTTASVISVAVYIYFFLSLSFTLPCVIIYDAHSYWMFSLYLSDARVGKNPGFLVKTQKPSWVFGFLLGFLGIWVFAWVFGFFLRSHPKLKKILGFFGFSSVA